MKSCFRASRLLIRLFLTFAFLGCVIGFTQEASNEPNLPAELASPSGGPLPLSEQSLDTFFTTYYRDVLRKNKASGAVAIAVHEGRILFAKGFGTSSLSTEEPMDPEKTILYLPALTPIITRIALMQLIEAGKLSMEDEINPLLNGIIPPTFAQPIRVEHLMTSTTGFDINWGRFVRSAEDIPDLDEFLKTHLPRRIAPPGESLGPYEFAMGISGQLIEKISTRPFAGYCREHIFNPLDMRSSSVDVRDRSTLHGHLATWKQTEPIPPIPRFAAASGFHASAKDIGTLMLALLGQGRHGDATLLSPESARLFLSPRILWHPHGSGMTPGFIYTPRDTMTILRAGGNDEIANQLTLYPEKNLGIFFASLGRLSAPEDQSISNRFNDAFFPLPPQPTRQATEEAASRARNLVGTYYLPGITGSRNYKLSILIAPTIVSQLKNGNIQIRTGRRDFAEYREIEPNLFRSLDNQRVMCFRDDGPGKPPALISPYGIKCVRADQGIPVPLHFRFLGLTLLILISYLVFWPVGSLIRIVRKLPPLPQLARITGWTIGAVSFLAVTFTVGFFMAYGKGFQNMLDYAEFGPLRSYLMLPLIFFWPTIGLPFLAGKAWLDGWWSLSWRIYASVVTFACLGFLGELYFWNLIGFNF